MRISNVSIKRFRSIQEAAFDVPQVCALIGPNNAGKSNILAALNCVLGREWVSASSFDEADVCKATEEDEILIQLAIDPPLAFQKFKFADAVDIPFLRYHFTKYKVGDRKGERRLEQTCLDAKGKPVMVPKSAPKKGVQTQFEPMTSIPQEVKDAIPLIFIGSRRPLKEQLPSYRTSLLRQLFDDINQDLHRPDNVVNFIGPDGVTRQTQRAARFNEVLAEALSLLKSEAFEQLESSIKNHVLRQLGLDPVEDTDKFDLFFSPFSPLEFYRSLQLNIREGDYQINATELGEGLQNAIVLAILQAFEERRKQGAIILIEEPEMFLHPQLQRSLYRTLRSIGESNQVIYTTHSPHFVTIPDFEHVRIVRKGPQGTKVIRSSLPTSDKFSEKLRKEFDPERNELFFANRLLLVEGDTEKLAFPEYAKRLGIDLDNEGASIVEVGGKRNLMDFAKIADSFGIPTGMIFDEDSTDIEDPNEEAALNATLLGMENENTQTRVWALSKKYEEELRSFLGEKEYQLACQKYPGLSKATRQRLIAQDSAYRIPDKFENIVRWLANREVPELEAK